MSSKDGNESKGCFKGVFFPFTVKANHNFFVLQCTLAKYVESPLMHVILLEIKKWALNACIGTYREKAWERNINTTSNYLEFRI